MVSGERFKFMNFRGGNSLWFRFPALRPLEKLLLG
jgi:hypothetical protein